ncbi:MAG: hypothetical protein AAF517_17865 [Planctomycetota bacterium]
MRAPGRCPFLLLVTLSVATPALSFEEKVSFEGIEFSIFAPDWNWRGRAMSVLVTARRSADSSANAREERLIQATLQGPVSFKLPEALAPIRFTGEITRFAFPRIVAGADAPAEGAQLALSLRVGDSRETVEVLIPVLIIRGSILPKGLWSILVPTLLALVTLPLFLAFLRREAGPRWWRELPPSVLEDANDGE